MTELDFREVIERFDEILDGVERGETFRVFRDGRAIAILERSRFYGPDQVEAVVPPA
jgi:hypothetical protein